MLSTFPCRPPRLRVSLCSFAAVAASLLAAAPASAYVGQWHGYTDQGRVTALIEHNGFVYAGTRGGIRRVQTETLAQREFNHLDGLLDPWITGFARNGEGVLWAASRDGYLYTPAKGGNRWEVAGRSYAAQLWTMNDRAILAAGSYLYLGSQKGLSVFDTKQRVAQLNLTRFGSETDLPVLSLLRREDTLYAGTPAGVFKIYVNFADPLNPPQGASNFADPNQWVPVSLPPDPLRQYNHLAFIGDSLNTFGPGTLLQPPEQAPVEVRAFADSPLVVGSHTYSDGWNGHVTAVMTGGAAGGKLFTGGDSGLSVFTNLQATAPDSLRLPPAHFFPAEPIANIGAYGGRAWGHSLWGIHRISPNSQSIVPSPAIIIRSDVLYSSRGIRNLKVAENGNIYIGAWGQGLVRVHNGSARAWPNNDRDPGDSCLIRINPNYPVVHALSAPRAGKLFFSVFLDESGSQHQLAYLNTVTEKMTCLDSTAAGRSPHALHIFAAGPGEVDTLLGIASDRGVEFIVFREGVSAPNIESKTLWTLPGTANEAWDLTTDGWNRPWALIGSRLAYVDSLEQSTSHNLKPIDNFTGTNCKNLETDPEGALWVGCENGLFHVQTAPDGELTSVRRYTMDDGLPSLTLYDVTVDPVDGRVWVATDRGVGMFESSARPSPPNGSLPGVVPYPNPFRPQHAFVIFDNLPRNSTLRIHGPTGTVVRTFRPGDLQGNQAQWDGRNENGKPVKPGVYLFSVTSGSAVQRGKIIVAR